MLFSGLRRRGVAFSRSSSAAYSAETGTETASNSSGLARFLPIEETEDEEGTGSGKVVGGELVFGIARLSGVRALKTTGCEVLRSGVLGRGMTAGPEAARLGLDHSTAGCVGIAGIGGTSWDMRMCCDDDADMRRMELIAAGAAGAGEMNLSVAVCVDGTVPLAVASLACRLCTLRVNMSTFPVSFFFSLSIL